MWEVWRMLERFPVKAPVAWFGVEETAREYIELLATVGVEADLHYNETAVFTDDYSTESEWFGVPIPER